MEQSQAVRQLVQALGWFSVGLGIAQLLAPRAFARSIGVPQRPGLLHAVGAREVACGIGILSRRQRAPWLWARVAGDAMDLALVGAATRSVWSQRPRLRVAVAAIAGVAAIDVLAGMRYRQQQARMGEESGVLRIEKSLVINRSPEECYRFWRDFENFPSFMRHLESVRFTGENRSHWQARAPAGTSVEWDAELSADQPGRRLAWHSLPGSDIDHSGSVRFESAPRGHGTIVRVELQYSPPGGTAGVMTS